MERLISATRLAALMVQKGIEVLAGKCMYTHVARFQVRTVITAKEKGSAEHANGLARFSVPYNFIGVHDHGLV